MFQGRLIWSPQRLTRDILTCHSRNNTDANNKINGSRISFNFQFHGPGIDYLLVTSVFVCCEKAHCVFVHMHTITVNVWRAEQI